MRELISTDQAPKAIGPYSQAVKTEQFIFVSGQIALVPSSGEMVEGGIVEQTRQVLENVSAVLKGANSSLQSVVKVSVFLQNIQDFAQMNEVYAEYFQESLPAREAIQAAALPKNALVEISVIAQTT